VWGNFNGLMANAFLVAVDELEKQKAKDMAQIKGLITEPTLPINQKGKGQYIINMSLIRFTDF
jgi:phage/plasmid-associated DNA primase